MKKIPGALLLLFSLAAYCLPVAAQQYCGSYGHSWEAARESRSCENGAQFAKSWCESARHECAHTSCEACTAPASACSRTSATPARFCSRAAAAPERSCSRTPAAQVCNDAMHAPPAHRAGTIASSWCDECRHEHCTPGHLYTKNCAMIDELQFGYCVSPNYVASLRVKNDNCYGNCRGYASSACPQCSSSEGAGSHRSLAALNSELEGLSQKCRPVN